MKRVMTFIYLSIYSYIQTRQITHVHRDLDWNLYGQGKPVKSGIYLSASMQGRPCKLGGFLPIGLIIVEQVDQIVAKVEGAGRG